MLRGGGPQSEMDPPTLWFFPELRHWAWSPLVIPLGHRLTWPVLLLPGPHLGQAVKVAGLIGFTVGAKDHFLGGPGTMAGHPLQSHAGSGPGPWVWTAGEELAASVFPRGSLSSTFQASITKPGFPVPVSGLSTFLRRKLFIDGLFITDVT